MKAKQTVKKLLVCLVILAVSASGFFAYQPANAAECGGVDTSIISCGQKGQSHCKDGSNPFEGTEPKTSAQKDSYLKTYNHSYGKCLDGSAPVTDITSTGLWGVLLIAINVLTAGVGVAAVGGIVYGALLYTSAGGSPEQVKKAMGIITNVVIGVVAYALMYALLNFLIPGGIFN